MKKFVVLYSGGKAPTTPQEGEASMKVWTKWFEGLGKSVVDAGAPFGASKTVNGSGVQDGASGNITNGYSVFQADDLAGAAKIVKGCPIVSEGGRVHVFELMAM
ncbi:MAG TPA: hypothetical protein VMV03_00630 [Spirochaetia bacterium]|nr:hypothetical protein [Spirochaetia bacterium]